MYSKKFKVHKVTGKQRLDKNIKPSSLKRSSNLKKKIHKLKMSFKKGAQCDKQNL